MSKHKFDHNRNSNQQTRHEMEEHPMPVVCKVQSFAPLQPLDRRRVGQAGTSLASHRRAGRKATACKGIFRIATVSSIPNS